MCNEVLVMSQQLLPGASAHCAVKCSTQGFALYAMMLTAPAGDSSADLSESSPCGGCTAAMSSWLFCAKTVNIAVQTSALVPSSNVSSVGLLRGSLDTLHTWRAAHCMRRHGMVRLQLFVTTVGLAIGAVLALASGY